MKQAISATATSSKTVRANVSGSVVRTPYSIVASSRVRPSAAADPSATPPANCYDNAVLESFFATLEWGLIERSDWATRDAAHLAIFEYIGCWYNPKRRHSSLGYLSPAEYERQLLRQAA